VGIGTRGMVPE